MWSWGEKGDDHNQRVQSNPNLCDMSSTFSTFRYNFVTKFYGAEIDSLIMMLFQMLSFDVVTSKERGVPYKSGSPGGRVRHRL